MKNTIIVITLFASTALAAAEGNHSDGHMQGMTHWMAPAEASAKPNPIESNTASIDRGKKTYFQYCASCHGAKAMGDGPASAALNPKPANLTVMAGMHPDGDFAWKINNGRGAMPAWKTLLNEAQIWELVNYIQNLKPQGKMKMMDMSGMDHSKMNHEEMGHSDGAEENHKEPNTEELHSH